MSTHLRNLVASTDPLKGYIKPYLIEADFAKVHELDPRKFSRYHELSYYSGEFRVRAPPESRFLFCWAVSHF